MRIALLGAGGQIGRGLAVALRDGHELFLFSRNPGGSVRPYASFARSDYDVVVNAAGPGDPNAIRTEPEAVFRTTEFFDNLVLDYLETHSGALYVFLSSGAVYVNGYATMATRDSTCTLPVNRLGSSAFYPLAKLNAEAKHRASARYNIADIRIFGYFSRHIDLKGGFFLSEVADAVATKRPFRTTRANFIRDYVSATDIARLIDCIVRHGHQNQAYDLVSAAPVSKADLLAALSIRFGLRVEVVDSTAVEFDAVTPLTSLSDQHATLGVGYSPSTTSLDVVQREMQAIVEHFKSASTH